MFLLLSSLASAQDLAYHWPTDKPVNYQVQMRLGMPYSIPLQGAENVDARFTELVAVMLLECTAQAPGRKTQEVVCDPRRVMLTGVAMKGDSGRGDGQGGDGGVTAVLTEYEESYENATIVLTFTLDGRLKTVDVEGVPRTTQREAQKLEWMRLIAIRALCPLDLQLPKDATGEGGWTQKEGSIALSPPAPGGSAGAARVGHEVESREGGQVVILSGGEATMQLTQSTSDSSSTSPTISMMMSGKATFDANQGVLVRSERVVQGVRTASTMSTGNGLYIDQVTLITQVADFAPIEAEMDVLEGVSAGNAQ